MNTDTRPFASDAEFWQSAIDTVVEMLRHLLDGPPDDKTTGLRELWSRLDPAPTSEPGQISLDKLCAHIDADQIQRRIMILAVAAALAADRIEPLLGRRHGCSRYSLTVGDVLTMLGLDDPLERVRALLGFRQRSRLGRLKLLEISFGFEPETVVDLVDARVAATYQLVDVVFDLAPVEAVVIPDGQPAEHPEWDA